VVELILTPQLVFASDAGLAPVQEGVEVRALALLLAQAEGLDPQVTDQLCVLVDRDSDIEAFSSNGSATTAKCVLGS
jgi:hypothetical protein